MLQKNLFFNSHCLLILWIIVYWTFILKFNLKPLFFKGFIFNIILLNVDRILISFSHM